MPCHICTAGPGPLNAAQQQPTYVLQALGVLALIIAVHEAGHFAAARVQVRVLCACVTLHLAHAKNDLL